MKLVRETFYSPPYKVAYNAYIITIFTAATEISSGYLNFILYRRIIYSFDYHNRKFAF